MARVPKEIVDEIVNEQENKEEQEIEKEENKKVKKKDEKDVLILPRVVSVEEMFNIIYEKLDLIEAELIELKEKFK